MRLPWLLCAALAVLGCGPSVSYDVRDARAYTTSRRCSQGPHEIDLRAIGSRWGEEVEVYACSPRAIQGHWSIEAAGSETDGEYGRQREAFGMREFYGTRGPEQREERLWEDVDAPENQRCVATETELAGAGSSTATSGGTPAAPAGPAGAASSTTSTVVQERLDTRPLPAQEGDLICPVRGLARYDVGRVSWYVMDPDDPAPLTAGAQIRVRLWSDVPNDLEGVTLVVRHRQAVPSVDDEEWAEHLREENREFQAESDERQREMESEQAECDRDPECVERRTRRYRAQIAAAESRQRTETRQRRTEPAGSPPALRAETQPPTPSVHAEWIPGYWHWSADGATWAWIGGRWRVPEADISAGLTTRAPSAPPSLRAEVVPPSPFAGAVWTAGHWQWDSRAWVWVSGSWQLPPTAGLQWQAPSWRPSGAVMVFIPGGWLR